MLKLNIKPVEFYDDNLCEFITVPGLKLTLEHSLYTISKWESRWMKPFMGNNEKSDDEILDYILCMDITETLTIESIQNIQQVDLSRILTYINSNMSATTFNNSGSGKSNEIVTSELIYYWMITLQIPLDCEHWHLNRLMTLIRICNIKNSPPKKQDKQAALSRQRELNKQRKMQNNSTG